MASYYCGKCGEYPMSYEDHIIHECYVTPEEACHALAAGLLGVCWAHAVLVGVAHLRNVGGKTAVVQALDWALDMCRPPGCQAPWEDK